MTPILSMSTFTSAQVCCTHNFCSSVGGIIAGVGRSQKMSSILASSSVSVEGVALVSLIVLFTARFDWRTSSNFTEFEFRESRFFLRPDQRLLKEDFRPTEEELTSEVEVCTMLPMRRKGGVKGNSTDHNSQLLPCRRRGASMTGSGSWLVEIESQSDGSRTEAKSLEDSIYR